MMEFQQNTGRFSASELANMRPKKGRKRGGRNINFAVKIEATEEAAALVRNEGVTRIAAATAVIAKFRLSVQPDTIARLISAKL